MTFKLTAAALLIVCGLPAQADTSYTASQCHADTKNGRALLEREARGLFNRRGGTVRVSVSCPIMRDNTQNTNGVSVSVRVSGDVRCTLNARDAAGNANDPNARDSGSHSGSGNGVIHLRTFKSYAYGPYEFACELKRGAGVTGYFVDE